MFSAKPWDLHADLTSDRLLIVANIVREVREDCRRTAFNPAKGDTLWSLGCHSYERTRHRLIEAAKEHPWLTILCLRPHFVFKVGAVPMRVYSGEAGEPKERWLRRSAQEREAQQLAFAEPEFGMGTDSGDWCWRILATADDIGKVTGVFFAEMQEDDGECRHVWEAPESTVIPAVRRPAQQDPARARRKPRQSSASHERE